MFQYLKRLGHPDNTCPIIHQPAKKDEVFSIGEPVNLESGLCTAGAPEDTDFVGIANESETIAADGDDLEIIAAYPDVLFRVPYTAGSKTSLTDADIGTAFDLDASDNGKIDLDDATNGAWVVRAYNNTDDTADVTLLAAKRADTIA